MTPQKRLLLLSNSTNFGQTYLEHAVREIRDFLGNGVRQVAFVPYAAVTTSWESFSGTVRNKFMEIGYEMTSVAAGSDPHGTVRNAEAIVIGGGNTFHLLYHLYKSEIMDDICDRVRQGIPYIGWSAGANVACPTIKTTNDMPIICPPHLEALNLVPFQINPHYLDVNPEHHQGETREQRLLEFLRVNPNVHVVGLREGSLLRVEGSVIKLLGNRDVRIFLSGREPREMNPHSSFDFLLQTPS